MQVGQHLLEGSGPPDRTLSGFWVSSELEPIYPLLRNKTHSLTSKKGQQILPGS